MNNLAMQNEHENNVIQKYVSEGNLGALQASGALDINFITRNEQTGKVKVTKEALAEAFGIIDKNNLEEKDPKNMKLKLQDIKKRMQVINPNFPVNELSLMTGNKQEMSLNELYDFLTEFEIDDMDPINEALDLILDNDGVFDPKRFKKLAQGLGYPEMKQSEIQILQECLDLDHDGKISRKDFKQIFKYIDENQTKKQLSSANIQKQDLLQQRKKEH